MDRPEDALVGVPPNYVELSRHLCVGHHHNPSFDGFRSRRDRAKDPAENLGILRSAAIRRRGQSVRGMPWMSVVARVIGGGGAPVCHRTTMMDAHAPAPRIRDTRNEQ
jgi:hypothetical protein